MSAETHHKKTLKELREEAGLSREELAVKLKVPFSTLVNIEMGRNMPRVGLAEKIYQFFDLPLGAIDWDTPILERKNAQQTDQNPKINAPAA